jgi:hypothetical protein
VGSAIDTAYVLGGSIASIIFVILITTISSDYWEYIKKLMNKVFGNEKD